MKRAAITGHTSGVGAALTDYFLKSGYTVLGISRGAMDARTGLEQLQLDISNTSECVSRIAEFDPVLFVNNAWSGFAQVELLRSLAVAWQGSTRVIFNISSNASDFALREPEIFANTNYDSSKLALDHQSRKTQFAYDNLRIVNFRPGLIDTPRGQKFSGWKMPVTAIVDAVEFSLKMLERGVYVQECTFSHCDQFSATRPG